MNGQMKFSNTTTTDGPYPISVIPNIKIDYRGLVKYAREKGCHVYELSDEEKNRYISNGDMNTVRSSAISEI